MSKNMKDDNIPETIPGMYFAIFIVKNEYAQVPEFDPNHPLYRTIRSDHYFCNALFHDYESAIRYIHGLYPNAERINALLYYDEEENDSQITSMTDIYVQHCVVDDREVDKGKQYKKMCDIFGV